jgi:DNA topoisomerase-6 subunit B
VAGAVSIINAADEEALYNQLLLVAKKKTAEADVKLDERGRPIEASDEEEDFGDNVLIVEPPTSAP